MEIVEVTGKRGRAKWQGRLVTLMEAARRKKEHAPIVRRDAPGERFLFSLTQGDTIELDDPAGQRRLYIVRAISNDLVEFSAVNDARRKDHMKKSHDWGKRRVNALRALACRKLSVTPLGEVRNAGG